MFDSVEYHLIIKWLHDVIACTLFEGIFCNSFLPHCGNYNKIRMFLQSFVIADHFHYAKTVHFRHDDVKQNNIGLFFFNQMIHVLSVVCLSHQL